MTGVTAVSDNDDVIYMGETGPPVKTSAGATAMSSESRVPRTNLGDDRRLNFDYWERQV